MDFDESSALQRRRQACLGCPWSFSESLYIGDDLIIFYDRLGTLDVKLAPYIGLGKFEGVEHEQLARQSRWRAVVAGGK